MLCPKQGPQHRDDRAGRLHGELLRRVDDARGLRKGLQRCHTDRLRRHDLCGRLQGRDFPLLWASWYLGNVWVFVQLIFGPPLPMNQLNKNPNIAYFETSRRGSTWSVTGQILSSVVSRLRPFNLGWCELPSKVGRLSGLNLVDLWPHSKSRVQQNFSQIGPQMAGKRCVCHNFWGQNMET